MIVDMFTLIVLVVFGIAVAFFATQNTQPSSIVLANYEVTSIPMYIVVLGAMLFGIFVSWIISLVNSIASGIATHGKDSLIKASKKEVNDLTRRVHDLELENAKLKGEKREAETR